MRNRRFAQISSHEEDEMPKEKQQSSNSEDDLPIGRKRKGMKVQEEEGGEEMNLRSKRSSNRGEKEVETEQHSEDEDGDAVRGSGRGRGRKNHYNARMKAKFSLGGEEEDGENGGSSSMNPSSKRKRTPVPINAISDLHNHNQPRHCDNEETETNLGQIIRHQPHEQVTDDDSETSAEIVEANSSISMFFIDPEVWDCSICCNPLTAPIFQCENGHIACSLCCKELKNKCASCSIPIGYNRCRAVEKILESIKLPCKQSKYGCKEIVGYGNESDHEKTCRYAPCKCPDYDCNFMASSKQLSLHFSTEHKDSGREFKFNSSFFVICFKKGEESYVLREQDDGSLFILKSSGEILGTTVKICCLRSPTSKEAFSYQLRVEAQDHSLVLKSPMENIRSISDFCHSTRFLLIPCDDFGSSSKFRVDICIWKNGSSPMCDK